MFWYYLGAFVFGTIVGSFLNVVINRADSEESALKGHSHCPYCGKTLSWWELVPIFSFIFLRGHCSSCHHKLSLQYPLVEGGTALIFVSLLWYLERLAFFSSFNHLLLLEKVLVVINIGLLFYWLSVLIAVSVYDLKKYLILNEILFPAIILAFIWKISEGVILKLSSFNFSFLPSLNHFLGSQNYLFGYYSFFHSFFLGTIFFAGVISLLAFLTHEKAMGWGDAILALFLGMILGWPEALIALIIAFLSGGFISLILIALKKKTFHSYIPFAPFLTLGALTVMLFGDIIIKAYLSLI